MMKTQLFTGFLLFSLFFNFQAFAQNALLRGTVKDANGQTLVGASVTVQGSSKGTLTDNNGNYSLSLAPGKYTVVVSYVGYATQRNEITVTDKGAS